MAGACRVDYTRQAPDVSWSDSDVVLEPHDVGELV